MDKRKLFKQYKGGRGGALLELLEEERQPLYDYMLRMTGQISKASETVDEVVQTLLDGAARDLTDLDDFYVTVYGTARKFNADIWNADVMPLTHPHLGQKGQMDPMVVLDSSLRRLAGPCREAVVLRAQVGVGYPLIAAIMNVSEEHAESLYDDGLQTIDAECSGRVERPEAALAQLPSYPIPEKTSAMTMDLSMVMEGIRTKPSGLTSISRVLFLLLIILVVIPLGVAYFLPDFWAQTGLPNPIKMFAPQLMKG